MRITAAQVRALVAEYYDLDVRDLVRPHGTNELVYRRFMAWSLTRKHCPHVSSSAIGRVYGDRDHSTILYGIARFKDIVKTDGGLQRDYDLLDGVLAAWSAGVEVPIPHKGNNIERVREIHLEIARLATELYSIKEGVRLGAVAA